MGNKKQPAYKGVKNLTRTDPGPKLPFRFREHCRGCEFIESCSLACISTEKHNGEVTWAEYINEYLEKASEYKMKPVWDIDSILKIPDSIRKNLKPTGTLEIRALRTGAPKSPVS